MKKVLYTIISVAIGFIAFSCAKDPVEVTATVDAAGDWYVQVDGCDADGNVIEGFEDVFGIGDFHIITFNTSENKSTEMYVFDLANETFWDFQVKVDLNLATLSFSTDGFADNEIYESQVKISNGKITPNGAVTPSGMPADAIEFYVLFDDDEYAGEYYDILKVHGYRYTGFVADE